MKVPITFLILTLGGSETAVSHACPLCTCTAPPNVQAALRAADVVLRARVVTVDALPPDAGGAWVSAWPEGRRVTLDVRRVWKGELGERAEVFTGFGFGDCGYPFEAGAEYVVFARRATTGRLVTAVCTRTGLATEMGADFDALGPGRAPAPRSSDSAHRPQN
jgi:hypothetical protein